MSGIFEIVSQCRLLKNLSIYECPCIPSGEIAQLNKTKENVDLKIHYTVDSSHVSDLFDEFDSNFKKKWKKDWVSNKCTQIAKQKKSFCIKK